MSDDWRPDIFGFVDFRAYLSAYYDAAKLHTRAFSYRYFSRRAGFASPNFLKLVIDGKRNLGHQSIERFARALGLDRAEGRFFADLVAFGQASTDAERNEAFERVAASRRFRRSRRLDQAVFHYLSRWYYPAIREMAARPDFQEDPAWIADQLLPRIRPAQAREALALLLELGLLVRDEDGRARRGDPSLTTGHEVRALAVGNFHREMMARAGEAIERVPREERDLSALTVCVSEATVTELKDRIHRFRERLPERCDADPEPERVYQIGIQLFPLTRGLEAGGP